MSFRTPLRSRPLSLALLLCGSAVSAAAPMGSGGEGDWPQWRGPNRDGLAPETQWVSEGREEPLWMSEVGVGYSNVVIQGDRLITMGFSETGISDVVRCFDAETGEELWNFGYDSKLWDNMHEGGTLTTPAVEGDRVFVQSRIGPFFCLNSENGHMLWERDMVQDFEIELGAFGLSASPLVLDEMLVLNLGRTIALDKQSGKTIWATEDYGYAYAVPATMEQGGESYLVVPNDIGYAVLERATGAEVAVHPVESVYHTNVATPIVIDSRIFVSTGFDGGSCSMLELTEEGLEVVWSNKRMLNKMTGCVLIDEHLYGFDDAVLKCLDLEGNERWVKRGLGTGALSGAGDRLIVLSEEGELLIAPATPEGFEPESSAKVFEEGVCWTVPVLSKGRIYCRNNKGRLVARNHRADQ